MNAILKVYSFCQHFWGEPTINSADENSLDIICSPAIIRRRFSLVQKKHPNQTSNLLRRKMRRWGYQKTIKWRQLLQNGEEWSRPGKSKCARLWQRVHLRASPSPTIRVNSHRRFTWGRSGVVASFTNRGLLAHSIGWLGSSRQRLEERGDIGVGLFTISAR